MLADITPGRVADERRSGLSRAYRAALHRPVLTLGEAPEGLCLPTLGEAYVNPEFRVAEGVAAERLAEESWWNEQPVRGDLEGFLAGHLTAPQAVAAPLLLLGQPGSGKSVLTQVLAARLPADEFLVVRVVLREVAADADLQTQIEDAVRSATGESLAWPDLARSAGGALLVVLLDGFDELLQATGVSQTDYLRGSRPSRPGKRTRAGRWRSWSRAALRSPTGPSRCQAWSRSGLSRSAMPTSATGWESGTTPMPQHSPLVGCCH